MGSNRQFPGFPGFPGFPSFPPTQGPFIPGGGQPQAPTTPPPSFIPQLQDPSIAAVDPGAIRGCLFRFTFIRLENGDSFWFFPTFVGRRSVAGFRWFGFFWSFFGVDLRSINSFQCF